MSDPVPSHPLVKRPSRLLAWLRAAEFGLQAILAAAFVTYGVRAYVVRTRLQETFAQLDRTDPGWRLPDVEAARAVIPDDENSALLVTDVGRRLPWSPKPWIEEDFATQLQQLAPQSRMTADQAAHLGLRLKDIGPILVDARRLSALPRGRFPITYARNPLNTMLEAQQKARRVLQLLCLDAMDRAQTGDAHGAMISCRAALNAGRSIGDEPTAISQLIRIACVSIACKTAGRILAQGEPDPDDLKTFQELLQEEEAFSYWDVTLRGERAFENATLEALESGNSTLSELAGDPPDWQERCLPFITEDYVRGVHPQLFTYMARLQAAGQFPPKGRDQAIQQVAREAYRAGLNPATIFLSSFPKLADAFPRSHAVVRCTITALAAERYRRWHGDWPPSLDALTPDLVAAVPTDPFSGDPLLYRRLPDGVVIYSVSTDGVDNGGNVDAENPTLPGADLGVRLWDAAKRRQPPAPAH